MLAKRQRARRRIIAWRQTTHRRFRQNSKVKTESRLTPSTAYSMEEERMEVFVYEVISVPGAPRSTVLIPHSLEAFDTLSSSRDHCYRECQIQSYAQEWGESIERARQRVEDIGLQFLNAKKRGGEAIAGWFCIPPE